MTIIVLDVISLILQGVERLVFNFPSGPAPFDKFSDIAFIDMDVPDPTVLIGNFAFIQYPEPEKIYVTGSTIQGNLVYPFIGMCLAL